MTAAPPAADARPASAAATLKQQTSAAAALEQQTSAAAALERRTSACPGLLRIVPARDGGICRIRLACGRVTTAQARAIADAAAQWGSGVIEITNRANLQLRGVEAAHADPLVAALLGAGLGPLVPGGDDVRNVLVSPTADIDVDRLIDTGPLATCILERLQTRPALRALSPKFAISLDGGERAIASEHPHDLWLAALADGAEFALGLAGCVPVAVDDTPALAAVPQAYAVEAVEAVLQLFVECAGPGQSRMRDVLAELPRAEFLRRLQQRLAFPLRVDADLAQWRRTPPEALAHIGVHAQRDGSPCYVGAQPALGRIDAAQLRGLAALADEYGADLRATPWQGVLLANVAVAQAPRVAARLGELGFHCDAHAVLTHTIACSGAVGCAKGRGDTKSDALLLATLLEQRFAALEQRVAAAGARDRTLPSIHLTGCERSCAAPQRAQFTLLADAPGLYTIYRRTAGAAGFGATLAQSADIATAAALIAATFLEIDA